MSSPNIHPEYAAIIKEYTDDKKIEIHTDPSEDPYIKDAPNVDRFGFYHPDGFVENELNEEQKQRQLKRIEKWRLMTHRVEEVDSMWQRMFRGGQASEKLTSRIYKGIPERYRLIVWPLLLSAPEAKKTNNNIYSNMLARALATSNDLGQIDLDIHRTFRNTTYFRVRYGSRQRSLFRILAAYSVYNMEVGYCQGMSELVAFFLTYVIEEEDVFWCMSQLMISQKHNLHGIFVMGFPGLQRLFTHHENVLQRMLPSLNKHFEKQQILTSTYTLKWFMQCFIDRLPVSLVLRLWDIYLLEGERLLVAMAYNILKMHKKRLLRMDQMQIISFFQDELAKNFQYEDDTVIDSLKACMERLRKCKLDVPPPLTSDMKPKRPFGSPHPDFVWQTLPMTKSKPQQIHDRKLPGSVSHIPTGRFNSASNGDGSIKLSTYLQQPVAFGFDVPATILTGAALSNNSHHKSSIKSTSWAGLPHLVMPPYTKERVVFIQSKRGRDGNLQPQSPHNYSTGGQRRRSPVHSVSHAPLLSTTPNVANSSSDRVVVLSVRSRDSKRFPLTVSDSDQQNISYCPTTPVSSHGDRSMLTPESISSAKSTTIRITRADQKQQLGFCNERSESSGDNVTQPWHRRDASASRSSIVFDGSLTPATNNTIFMIPVRKTDDVQISDASNSESRSRDVRIYSNEVSDNLLSNDDVI